MVAKQLLALLQSPLGVDVATYEPEEEKGEEADEYDPFDNSAFLLCCQRTCPSEEVAEARCTTYIGIPEAIFSIACSAPIVIIHAVSLVQDHGCDVCICSSKKTRRFCDVVTSIVQFKGRQIVCMTKGRKPGRQDV